MSQQTGRARRLSRRAFRVRHTVLLEHVSRSRSTCTTDHLVACATCGSEDYECGSCSGPLADSAGTTAASWQPAGAYGLR
jgi:hypothetical protein